MRDRIVEPSTGVSGVILAAGRATRFGSAKQLVVIDGQPLVRRIAAEACASRLDEILVVVGHAAGAVRDALAGAPVRVVENPDFARGQATSVRAGLRAVAPEATGAMFLVCDQPDLTAALIDRLLTVFAESGASIVVPTAGGRRGSPVIFRRTLFAELAALDGDTGGRPVVAAHPDLTVEVELPSDAPLLDLDTEADLTRWRRARGSHDRQP